MRVITSYLSISIVGFCLFTSSGIAGTYHVALDGSGDFTSIRTAVEAAVDGDYVVIHPGLYTGYAEIETDQNIVLKSTDPNNPEIVEQTVIFGLPDPYHFIVSNAESLTIEGLTFSGFYGINIIKGYCDDMLIRNCVFS